MRCSYISAVIEEGIVEWGFVAGLHPDRATNLPEYDNKFTRNHYK